MDFGEASKKIEASMEELSKITYNTDLIAAQQARVELERRTFATGGSGVKDIDGKSLSKYSNDYARRRKAAGLQTDNKDLVFSKDTSVIKDNIDVGTSEGKPALGHVKADGAIIAGYQEERENTIIFTINPTEKTKAVEVAKAYLMESLRNLVKSWH